MPQKFTKNLHSFDLPKMGNLNDPGVPCWNITPGHYIEGFGGPEFPSHKNDPHGSCNIFSDSCLSTKNYTPENVTWHWKIPVFNNNYTSSNAGISIVMLLFGGGNNPGDCWWDRGASLSKPPTNQSKKKWRNIKHTRNILWKHRMPRRK